MEVGLKGKDYQMDSPTHWDGDCFVGDLYQQCNRAEVQSYRNELNIEFKDHHDLSINMCTFAHENKVGIGSIDKML